MPENSTRSRMAIAVLVVAIVALGAVAILAWFDDGGDGTQAGSGLQVREVLAPDDGDSNTADGVTIKIAQARCKEDEVVTGGGFRIFGASRQVELQVQIKESLASSTTDGLSYNVWTAVAHAPEGIGDWGLDARAMCVKSAEQPLP